MSWTSGFLCGLLVGGLVAEGAVAWLVFRGRKLVIFERWWMENPERWEWLRQYELGTKAAVTCVTVTPDPPLPAAMEDQ